MLTDLLIRLIEPADYEQWLPLWDGYMSFMDVLAQQRFRLR
jgi:hypothetical protein